MEVNEVLQYNVKKHVETKECCFNERPNKKQLTTSAREFPKKVQTATFVSIYWCVIDHYGPILIVFVKYRVYSQLTLVQYLKIVKYCGWINQRLCCTLCWMKTIFLALRFFVTITENPMSRSFLADYGAMILLYQLHTDDANLAHLSLPPQKIIVNQCYCEQGIWHRKYVQLVCSSVCDYQREFSIAMTFIFFTLSSSRHTAPSRQTVGASSRAARTSHREGENFWPQTMYVFTLNIF